MLAGQSADRVSNDEINDDDKFESKIAKVERIFLIYLLDIFYEPK